MHVLSGFTLAAGVSGAVAVADGGQLSTLIAQVVVAIILFFFGRGTKR